MRVLILSPYPQEIAEPIISAGDEIVTADPDLIVSYGHRSIIKEPVLSAYAGKIINMHIAILPWNKGADPNFWSWIDGTPKGVTIHDIDAGIDTGPILAQRETKFSNDETLATSYEKLKKTARDLFSDNWRAIRINSLPKISHTGGSYHHSKDKMKIWSSLPLKFDTPVSVIGKILSAPNSTKLHI